MEVGGDFSTEVNKRASATPDSFEESNVSKSDVSSAEAYAQTGAHGGVQNGSPTQSPPIQTMARSEGYDPNRIPASVFASKAATTPLEWSVASSESLFSIHVGNPSFTNEFSQLSKSGELVKSPEYQPPSGLPPVTEAADMEKGRQTSAETTKGVSWASADVNEKMPPPLSEGFRNSSASHHSDESMNSTLSFAFPVLESDGRSSSTKDYAEKQQQEEKEQEQPQPQPRLDQQPLKNAPESAQNAAATIWFPCFSCCSFSFCF